MTNIKNYINGHFHNPIQDKWLDNYNPSNGKIYGQIPDSNKEDVENKRQIAGNLAGIGGRTYNLPRRIP